MLEDVFYHLYKDWGTQVVINSLGKGELDVDNGERLVSNDTSLSVRCIVCPQETLWKFFKSGQLPDKIRTYTCFLFLTAELPKIELRYCSIRHGGLIYRHLETEEVGGVLTMINGEAPRE